MSKSTIRRRNNQVLETEPKPDKEDELQEELNFEIECPRCSDVMELFSEFDQLSYYCGSCQLEMNVN